MMDSSTRPRKLRRVARACDFCHSRSSRRQQSSEDTRRCQKCVGFDRQRTYMRPIQKRGLKSTKRTDLHTTAQLTVASPDLVEEERGTREARRYSTTDGTLPPPRASVRSVYDTHTPTHSASCDWRAESMPEQEMISALAEISFDIIYPM